LRNWFFISVSVEVGARERNVALTSKDKTELNIKRGKMGLEARMT